MKNKLLIILIITFQINAFAQNKSFKGNEKFFKDLQNQLKNDQADLNKMFEKDVDKMNRVIESLRSNFFNNLDDIFKNGGDSLLNGLRFKTGSDIVTHWKRFPNKHIFKIHLNKEQKNMPIDINIKNNKIIVKMSVKSKSRIYNSKLVEIIPENLNSIEAKILKNGNIISIIFPVIQRNSKKNNFKPIPFNRKNSI